jgi:hypothetical protein
MQGRKVMEEYSAFSWESIQESIQEIYKKVQEKTGATDEQMKAAFAESTRKFMDTNFFKEPRSQE